MTDLIYQGMPYAVSDVQSSSGHGIVDIDIDSNPNAKDPSQRIVLREVASRTNNYLVDGNIHLDSEGLLQRVGGLGKTLLLENPETYVAMRDNIEKAIGKNATEEFSATFVPRGELPQRIMVHYDPSDHDTEY